MENTPAAPRMNKRLSLLLLAPLAFLSACVDIDTTIRIHADGTGIIEEQVLVNRAALEQVRQQYQKSLEKQGGLQLKGSMPELFNEQRLRMRAPSLGQGVSYLHGKKLERAETEGYQAFYGFDDIERLTINQDPGLRASDKEQGPSGNETPRQVGFRLEPGPPATLSIFMQPNVPAPKQKPAPPDEEDGYTEAAIEQMKTMFRGLRFAMHIEVLGEIIETNAAYRSGNLITLAEINFNRLLDDTDQLRALAANRPAGLAELRERLRDIPGMKVELAPEVRIVFRAPGRTPE